MKFSRTSQLTICILVLFIIFSGCSKKTDEKDTPVSKSPTTQNLTNVAAMVNGATISNDDLNKEVLRIQQRFYTSANMTEDQKNQVETEILKILINNELFYQASKELNISSSEEEIENGLKMTLEQYPNTENFTNTFTREEIIKKLAVEKFISQEFADKIIISDEQASTYYQENIDDFTRPEQVFASHILISVEDPLNTDQKQKALEEITKIQSQIKDGTPFSDLADQYSQGLNKMPGGQLGYVVRGQLDSELEKAVFALDPNQVSDIVITKYGYHLITVSEKQPQHIYPLEEISKKLKAFLKQKEIQKRIDTFITNQRKEATINTYL